MCVYLQVQLWGAEGVQCIHVGGRLCGGQRIITGVVSQVHLPHLV